MVKSLVNVRKVKEIAVFAGSSSDLNSAMAFGFPLLADHVLNVMKVGDEKKSKVLGLFEGGLISSLQEEGKVKMPLERAEKIKKSLSISREFLKKELDNPEIKRFESSYSRSAKTGKKEMSTTTYDLKTLESVFKKSISSVLGSRNKEFEDSMSKYAGRFVLEFESQLQKNNSKRVSRWLH